MKPYEVCCLLLYLAGLIFVSVAVGSVHTTPQGLGWFGGGLMFLSFVLLLSYSDLPRSTSDCALQLQAASSHTSCACSLSGTFSGWECITCAAEPCDISKHENKNPIDAGSVTAAYSAQAAGAVLHSTANRT